MKVNRTPEGITITAEGNFIAECVGELRTELQAVLAEASQGLVVLDLSLVDFIDSSGLALVIGTFKSCEKKKLEFRVDVRSPAVSRIFKTCKLHKIMNIHEI